MTFRLVFAILLFLTAIGLIIAGSYQDHRGETVPLRKFGWWTLIGALVMGILSCIRIVAPGEVGIPVTLGKIGTQIGPGIHFVNPLAEVQTLTIRTENYTMSGTSDEGAKAGNDAVQVLGSDGAPAQVESTVLFHLNQVDADTVYRDLGTDYVNKVLRSSSRSCIRDVFGTKPLVDEATSGRAQVSQTVQDCVDNAIKNRGLTIEAFQLRDIKVDQSVQDKINAKVNAQQESEQQQFELTKTQQQAEIARVDAQGKADAQQIIACGGTTVSDDKGTHVVPRAGGDCLNTLTPAYLQYLYIGALQHVADSPNNSTVIIPFDQSLTPLLNVGGTTPR